MAQINKFVNLYAQRLARAGPDDPSHERIQIDGGDYR